ncbi:tannase and feruloyl esterase [Meredithblackwellia eburnea MCA 4105]
MRTSALLTVALWVRQATAASKGSAAACSAFKLPSSTVEGIHVVLTRSSHVPTGSAMQLTNIIGGTNVLSGIPSFCRLELTITTNATTKNVAHSEIWLPDTWNSRILGIGNGGWAGEIWTGPMGTDGVAKGYAAYGTDTGHTITTNASWALNKPEAIIDFTYRALHFTTIVAKSLTQSYYGKKPEFSYYHGCSQGGRQGLRAITKFPDDYDGVVVGAPANQFGALMAWMVYVNNLVTPVNSSRWIPDEMWPVIHQAVLDECDELDGVEDGVVSYPQQCYTSDWDWKLTCNGNGNNSTTLCLNHDQALALADLYADYSEERAVNKIFGGFYPGGELAIFGPGGLIGEAVFPLAPHDTTFDYHNLTYMNLWHGVHDNVGDISVVSPDLSAFEKKGGKVLHYAGLGDPLVSAQNSYDWVDSVNSYSKSNLNVSGDSFYRFFPVPGASHCGLGIGPNSFGGVGQRQLSMPPSNEKDPKYDIFASMVQWVEKGTAPAYLIGASYNQNNASLGLNYTRKLCPYPSKPVFKGGKQNTEASFDCK